MLPPPPNPETGRAIASRVALATDVLSGTVDLRMYPYRYVALGAFRHSGGLPALLTAVEWLEDQGWQLVNVFTDDALTFQALIRRRG